MKKIYNSQSQEIYHDIDNAIIKNVWLESYIDLDIHKEEMRNWMLNFEKIHPKYILTDASDNVVVPEMQEWILEFLFPKIIDVGVLKYAIVLSDEFFHKVSIENMFDEEVVKESKEFQQYFFSEEDKALRWLLE